VAYSSALPPYQIPGHPEDVRTEGNWQEGRRKDYAGMVESMDTGIGRILGALKDKNIADRTLVIYTHDHGGEWLSRNEPFFMDLERCGRGKFTCLV
jgi:arylsulfatase A-like enzyme